MCRPAMKQPFGTFLRTRQRHLTSMVLPSYFFGSSDMSRYQMAKSRSSISTTGASRSNGSGSSMSSYTTLPSVYSYAMSHRREMARMTRCISMRSMLSL